MKASVIAAGMLVAAATFVTGSAVQAAPPQAKHTATTTRAAKTPVAEKSKAVQNGWASGAVEKFDQASRTLVLKHDGKERTFVLAENANVMNGKQQAALTDLSIGRKVKVEYSAGTGAQTVSLVELEAVPAARVARVMPKK